MYGHASRLLVREGDSVQAGQVIALSGNSGRSTAPHLHFEIRREGKSLDPLTRSEEHTSELQSHSDLVCRLLLEKKNMKNIIYIRNSIRDDIIHNHRRSV